MQRESQKDRTILCKYEPTEPGDYRLEVKWSGEHVPGSPFMVMIFDTQEELSRFLQVNSTYNLIKQIFMHFQGFVSATFVLRWKLGGKGMHINLREHLTFYIQ